MNERTSNFTMLDTVINKNLQMHTTKGNQQQQNRTHFQNKRGEAGLCGIKER